MVTDLKIVGVFFPAGTVRGHAIHHMHVIGCTRGLGNNKYKYPWHTLICIDAFGSELLILR